MPDFPVLHYLPELARILVHWVGDVIQPSHPLLPTSPPAFNLLQHQSLSKWVTSWHHMAKVLGGASVSASLLPMSVQGCYSLGSIGLISLLSKGFPRVFSSTPVQNINFSALSLLYGPFVIYGLLLPCNKMAYFFFLFTLFHGTYFSFHFFFSS